MSMLAARRAWNNKYFRMLVAILAGNAVYFWLFRFLPPDLQHAPYAIDLGLLFDFLICLFFWFLIKQK